MSGTFWLRWTAGLLLLVAPAKGATNAAPAVRYLDAVLALCDRTEQDLNRYTAASETIADRHIRGGAFGAWWNNQCLGPEIFGRAGGFVNMGFDRAWSKDRSPAMKSNDVAFLGFDTPPWDRDRARLTNEAARGCWVVAFGPRAHPGLAPVAEACGTFFDTGYGEDDRVLTLPGGVRAGHMNHVANAVNGWVLMAETFGALTRRGKTPCMWKSYSYPDGKDWGNKYLGKMQFHDDYAVAPQPPGALGRAYLDAIRTLVRRLKAEQADALARAAALIAEEKRAGRQTVVAWAGHMPEAYVGKHEDGDWARAIELHVFLESQRKNFAKNTPDGALVLRLGYHGIEPEGPVLFKEKKDRVIDMSGENPDPAWQPAADNLINIPLGWSFGDACVAVKGYPISLFPPSGVMQAVAYEAIDAEVRARNK